MEEGRHTPELKVTESAQLEKAFLQRHRHGDGVAQVESSENGRRDVNWVASRDFSVEVGKKQIDEYIRSWELQPCWLYSLDFLYSTDEEHRTFYHYRARFSTPTPQRPIRGTASVYFAVDVSRVNPGTLPVGVLFAVESNRSVYTPRRGTFREKWLTDVIESKTLLRSAVDL